jgi:hypothetical protein
MTVKPLGAELMQTGAGGVLAREGVLLVLFIVVSVHTFWLTHGHALACHCLIHMCHRCLMSCSGYDCSSTEQ